MRGIGWIAVGVALVGCSKDPFEPGPWTIVAYQETNDTCGRSPEAQGIGEPISATFTWDDAKDLEIVGFGNDETWVYDAFGPSWSAGWDVVYEVAPGCEQTEKHTLVLTTTASDAVLIDALVGVGVRGGGCSTVETEGPCSFEIHYQGAFQGE